MYFQLVDNQVVSTQGQRDVNLHRLTATGAPATPSSALLTLGLPVATGCGHGALVWWSRCTSTLVGCSAADAAAAPAPAPTSTTGAAPCASEPFHTTATSPSVGLEKRTVGSPFFVSYHRFLQHLVRKIFRKFHRPIHMVIHMIKFW